MSVGEFCNRQVIVTDKSSSLNEVAQLMREHHVGCVLVVEQQEGCNVPAGIITDRDIVVEVIARQLDFDAVTAGDLMSDQLLMAREVDGLWETIKRMRSKGVRRVPVINDEQALVGILTIDDILEILTNELNEIVALISHEQKKEIATRTVP
jgi:CBS domain-containing protein